MTAMPDKWRNTARKARAAAGRHSMSQLDFGATTAIAHCKNEGCTVMLEIRGVDNWRFIRLGDGDCTVRKSPRSVFRGFVK